MSVQAKGLYSLQCKLFVATIFLTVDCSRRVASPGVISFSPLVHQPKANKMIVPFFQWFSMPLYEFLEAPSDITKVQS